MKNKFIVDFLFEFSVILMLWIFRSCQCFEAANLRFLITSSDSTFGSIRAEHTNKDMVKQMSQSPNSMCYNSIFNNFKETNQNDSLLFLKNTFWKYRNKWALLGCKVYSRKSSKKKSTSSDFYQPGEFVYHVLLLRGLFNVVLKRFCDLYDI